VPVEIADWTARTRAVELWIEQGLGKQATGAQKAAGECQHCAEIKRTFDEMSPEEEEAHGIFRSIKWLSSYGRTAWSDARLEVTSEIPQPQQGPLMCWKPYNAHIEAEIERRYPGLDRTPFELQLLNDLKVSAEIKARVVELLSS
jgi:hypothetical protein